MPDPVTHYVFGMQVLSKLSEAEASHLSKDVFILALQGPDPWSTSGFYGGKNKRFATRSSQMHREKTGFFLRELTSAARETQQKELFSFLAGFICHYCLDRTTHPYIVCKGGEWDGSEETFSQRSGHVRLERAIDCYYIRRFFGSVPWWFPLVRRIMPQRKYPESLKQSLDYVFECVYGWKDTFCAFDHGYRDGRLFYTLMQDPLGIVHYLLRLLSKGRVNYSIYSYFRRDADSAMTDYLNLKHEIWHHPFAPECSSKESFPELFHRALIDAVQMIRLAVQTVFAENEPKCEVVYGNSNYATGLDCDDIRNQRQPIFEPLIYPDIYWNV